MSGGQPGTTLTPLRGEEKHRWHLGGGSASGAARAPPPQSCPLVQGVPPLQVFLHSGTATCNFPLLEQCSKEQSQKQPSEGAVSSWPWLQSCKTTITKRFLLKILFASLPRIGRLSVNSARAARDPPSLPLGRESSQTPASGRGGFGKDSAFGSTRVRPHPPLCGPRFPVEREERKLGERPSECPPQV